MLRAEPTGFMSFNVSNLSGIKSRLISLKCRCRMDRVSIVLLDSLKNGVRFQMSYVMYKFIHEACVLCSNKYKSCLNHT